MDETENLLTAVATTIGSRHAENVASACLVHLLNRHGSARLALIAHLSDVSGIAVSGDLRFVGQAKDPSLGVTDISGVRRGVEEVVIEAKIRAGLHGDQIDRYLRRLGGNQPVLVLLAPAARLAFLWHAVCLGIGADPRKTAVKAGKVTIAKTSWDEVIRVIGKALAGQPDDATAELRQVEGLYRHIERGAFIPLTDDDVSPRIARLVESLASIATGVLARFLVGQFPDVVFNKKLGCSVQGFGRKGKVGGLSSWCGIWIPWWVEVAPTPFWLSFRGLDSVVGEHLVAVIQEAAEATTDDDRPSAILRRSKVVVVPLYAPTGVGQAEAVTAITDRVVAIGAVISASAIVAPSTAGGDERDTEQQDEEEAEGPE